MLFAGIASAYRKLAVKHYPDDMANRNIERIWLVGMGILVAVIWVVWLRERTFTFNLRSLPLLVVNASFSAAALLMGGSIFFPIGTYSGDQPSGTADVQVHRDISNTATLLTLTGIVGCYSSLSVRRSYTNWCQLWCFILAILCISSTAIHDAIWNSFVRRKDTQGSYGVSTDAPLTPDDKEAAALFEEASASQMRTTTTVPRGISCQAFLVSMTMVVVWTMYLLLNFTERLNHILSRWDSLAQQTVFLQADVHNGREFYPYLSNYFIPIRTGFLSLGWSANVCDCDTCGDRFSWSDETHLLPAIQSRINNSTACRRVLLSYKGQFAVSAARIRGIDKAIYHDLWQAFVDEHSWAHQESYLRGQEDSMSAPLFGYTMERMWNLLFQCNDMAVAWKCPTLISGWRIGGDAGDCQCFD